ncbi:Fe-S oxidoreductase [Labilithrix luteola]|uniref:Fe-S oxidoreductase n=1 Tax=Labilithrix luteola TaxID=1391654 RepID=A0A0K1PYQ7_9BACT|nr:(Fe-S)-binding protein [Labilithrix luteola]AKU98665.1 Fe-S oxidoreductase [Labilithrix luteola]
MNPTAMLVLIVGAHVVFFWSALRRWQLLRVGSFVDRFKRIPDRVSAVLRYAFAQEKMDYYQPAGWAHKLIFVGFIVLLARTIVLWGRGFDPSWNLLVLGPTQPLGKVYEFAKDIVALLVLLGVSVFFYYRVIKPQKRMTLSGEALVILGIIATMMLADITYDGAMLALASRHTEVCPPGSPAVFGAQCRGIADLLAPLGPGYEPHTGFSMFPSPAGSAMSLALKAVPASALLFIAHAGFWTHATLVLIFLNLLPHSKHFHIITGIPNVFFRDLEPRGRLAPMGNAEQLVEKLTAASELPDPTKAPIGIAKVEHLSWKAILDFYTCTECGRCSDNCPAHKTGKILSPKHLTLALRDHMYSHESELAAREMQWGPGLEGAAAADAAAASEDKKSPELLADEIEGAKRPKLYDPIDLVPNVIHPDVLWGCTTCRACEEQCPVLISYVDKIVDMRRNLVMIKNEFPHELQKPFQAMEVNGNPWNLSRMDRSAWSDGLDIKTFAEKPDAEVLYWVGCAASYDDRAKKIARATARLLKQAGIDFAILGQEESCTGDPARRAGNEMLFAMLAEGNAAVLNTYKEQGGMKTVVTACPHCFNTLKNEYPDFGAKLEVVHHTDFLMGLVASRKLVPKKPVAGRVVYHDSCYLGRYNDVYESPREILKSIPGVELVEPDYWTKTRGLCCGAGGAQMFMEEQNQNRVNVKRTLQLVDTGAKTVASACPFCMTMLTDGLKSQSLEDKIKQMDVAELLDLSCAVDERPASTPTPHVTEEVAEAVPAE